MKIKPLILAGLLATLSGCAAINPPSAYTSADIARAQSVTFGRVVAVSPEKIRVQGNGAVMRAGEQAGSAIGSTAGRTAQTGNAGAAIGQAVGGILAGGMEMAMNTADGLAITVKLDDGRTLAVLQPAKPTFAVGQRVAVGEFGGQTRVIDASTLTSARPDLTPRPAIKVADREAPRRTTQPRASEAKAETPKPTGVATSCKAKTIGGKSYKQCEGDSLPAGAQYIIVNCKRATVGPQQSCSQKAMKTKYMYLLED